MLQCRSCLTTKAEKFVGLNVPVENDVNFYDYFNECTQLNAMADDELPQMLCFNCSQDLLTAFYFMRIARQADQTLRIHLEQELNAEDDENSTLDMKNELSQQTDDDSEDDENKFTDGIDPLNVADMIDLTADTDVNELKSEELAVKRNYCMWLSNNLNDITCENSTPDNISLISLPNSQMDNELDDSSVSSPSVGSSQKSIKKKFANTYKCKCCEEVFQKKSSLRIHLRQSHQSELICKQCPKFFEYPKELKIHNNLVHSTNSPVQCKFCPQTSPLRRDLLAKHFRTKHNKRYYKYFPVVRRRGIGTRMSHLCEVCRRYFDSAAALCEHQQSHTDDKPYCCPYCSMNFRKKHILQAHEKEKHKEFNATAQGNKRLNDTNSLLCSYCPQLFKTERTLHEHEKRYHLQNLQRSVCHICHKEMNARYLKTHIKQIHTDPQKFICNICGNPFKGAAQLYTHKKLHMKREFKCTICYKEYTRQYDLTVHLRSHTGELPYECHLCDKKFAMKVRLTYHLQSHAGVKHGCEKCGKQFSTLQALKDHTYKHTGLPYRCVMCKYGTFMREVFARHVLREHSIRMSTTDLNNMFKKNMGRLPHISVHLRTPVNELSD